MIYRFLFLLLSISVWGEDLPIPALTGPVIDQASMLDSVSKSSISKLIRHKRNETGIQAQVFTINSLEGQNIDQYGVLVFEKWKLGDADKDNGILLLISKLDRKIRIEVGGGLEGLIPDLKAKRIINRMKPHFKAGRFSKGIEGAIKDLFLAADDPEAFSRSAGGSFLSPKVIHFIIILILVILSVMRKSKRANGLRTSRHRDHYWGGSHNGGGFGGSSGGGWSGGGGGSFGGGASGGW